MGLLHADLTGYVFVDQILKAADRGVRVRILLDDITTKGYDAGLAALDSHPHIEVRIFNPFSRRSARWWDFVTDLGRVNHRMHNKSMTFDNQVTIVGGRNIGDEYFDARQDMKTTIWISWALVRWCRRCPRPLTRIGIVRRPCPFWRWWTRPRDRRT